MRHLYITTLLLLTGLSAFGDNLLPGQAKVLKLKGEVLAISPSGEQNRIQRGDILQEGTQVITFKKKAECWLVFSNGSLVHLDERTVIDLASLKQKPFNETEVGSFEKLKVDPSQSEVAVKLRNGKLLNFVKKLNQDSTYEMKIPNAVAGVRGTTFGGRVLDSGYERCYQAAKSVEEVRLCPGKPETAKVSLQVFTGAVDVTFNVGIGNTPASGQSQTVNVEPGKQISYKNEVLETQDLDTVTPTTSSTTEDQPFSTPPSGSSAIVPEVTSETNDSSDSINSTTENNDLNNNTGQGFNEICKYTVTTSPSFASTPNPEFGPACNTACTDNPTLVITSTLLQPSSDVSGTIITAQTDVSNYAHCSLNNGGNCNQASELTNPICQATTNFCSTNFASTDTSSYFGTSDIGSTPIIESSAPFITRYCATICEAQSGSACGIDFCQTFRNDNPTHFFGDCKPDPDLNLVHDP